jgi:hypothetical protein
VIPIRTNRSNFVYRGPTPDIGDAWVERRRPREVYLTWKPSDEERARIAAGDLIELGLFGPEPIVPVSLNVADRPELSATGVALRDRAYAILRGISSGPAAIPAGHWIASHDLWLALCSEEALDTSGTGDLPLLYGRPLVEVEGITDALEYAVAVPS